MRDEKEIRKLAKLPILRNILRPVEQEARRSLTVSLAKRAGMAEWKAGITKVLATRIT